MSNILDVLRSAGDPTCNQVYMVSKMFGALFEADEDSLPEKVKKLRSEAAVRATEMAMAFKNIGFDFEKLVAPFLEKKLAYISQATSQAQIDAIFKPQVPFYNGQRFVTRHPYPIAEEELMCWSRASLTAPPNSDAVDRVKELTLEVFGIDLDKYAERNLCNE